MREKTGSDYLADLLVIATRANRYTILAVVVVTFWAIPSHMIPLYG
jgi:hypothetical protein